ncbi:iron transporter [Stenotrophomonas sp. S48]|nr:iron transporter [Stenotrophomonas sp. S48]MBK0046947.1 iron transporter [Stenotrophomonas sp. S49]
MARGNGHTLLWARGLLALLGGYAVAACWAAALARLLPGAKADATLVATMAAFVVYALAAIWAYAARSTLRAAVGLLAGGIVAVLIAWLLRGNIA